ncbi:MAG: S8 family peptidase [Bacteroidetes bacterium]|nr:S8 family peptidase [Bacteroidota bacterium]
MKNFTLILISLTTVVQLKAQQFTLKSNGHVAVFKKTDSLFFYEYSGQRPTTKTSPIDSNFSKFIMRFENSFGFTTNTINEVSTLQNKFSQAKRLYSTSYYQYADGTLQAPTSVIFFKPTYEANLVNDFTRFGLIRTHESLKGFYYLQVNTSVYSDGDKIFALCDTLHRTGLASVVEPIFVRRIKISSGPAPLFNNEWNITNTGQYNGTSGADMKVVSAWLSGYTGAIIRVAVIDLGVDLNHPDLQANLLPGYDATGNNSRGGPVYDANNSHGTSCAGIIAAIKNNIGGVGVAYNSKIIPIRLGIANQFGQFTATDTQVNDCFNFAINNGADIISNSWFWGSPSALIDNAIANATTAGRGNKGSIVLFAAGNNNSSILYPASNPNTIAVGASCECDTRKRSSSNSSDLNPGVRPDPSGTSCDGEAWWGSCFGTGLDVIAPGVHITTTTLPTGSDYSNAYINNFNGTSSATPNTAAILALILSSDPCLTGQQARAILESSVDKVGSYSYQSNVVGQLNGTWSTDAGYGRVNAYTAVQKAVQFSVPNLICSAATFSLTNQPLGSSVNWSSSNSNGFSINSTTGAATRVNNFNGQITITASIAGAGCSSSIQQTVWVGSPVFNTISIDGTISPYPLCGFGNIPFTANTDHIIVTNASANTSGQPTSVAYALTGTPGVVSGSTLSSTSYDFRAKSSNTSFNITGSASNSCGTTQQCLQFSNGADPEIITYPNPASTLLTVSVTDSISSNRVGEPPQLYRLNLYDRFGVCIFSTQTDQFTLQLPVSNLLPGIYYLNVFYKEAVLSKQVVINH